jgi:hypothetical protein
MKNKTDGEKGIAFLIGFVVFIAFLLGFCLGVEWNSKNSNQEQTQNIEEAEKTEDGKRQPYGLEYQDKETGVCYFVIKDDTEDIQAMAPRYNADGSVMVKEVEE